jgi:uncharacterized protein YodC (DUF2158 family)
VGMKVRLKATGEKGIITKINSDGTYEINPLNDVGMFPFLSFND